MKKNEVTKKTNNKKEMVILMFGMGFVMATEDYEIGQSELGLEGITVNSGATIRNWGTDNGIGELAARGPLPNTALDGVLFQAFIPNACIWEILKVTDKAVPKFQKGLTAAFKKIAAE